ncbi:hypothetical protein KCU65_g3610, partial [Aureobasidium melanogenum]
MSLTVDPDHYKTDIGVDGEDYHEKYETHRRYGYAMPSQESVTGALGATDVSDARVACFLNLDSTEVKSLKLAVREALRMPCRFAAKKNIDWEDEVVCERGDIPQISMLENNN